MSAPKFTVEHHEGGRREKTYWVMRETGECVCITVHADLARVISSHGAVCEALDEIIAEYEAGTIGRLTVIQGMNGRDETAGIQFARAALAKARGEG